MGIFKPNYLKMIKSDNWVDRRKAIWKIDDQKIIKEVAENDSDENVRIAAVNKLVDYTLLMKIAQYDLSANVREVAVSKLNHDSDLSEILKKEKNENVRNAATKNFTDKSELSETLDNEQNNKTKGYIEKTFEKNKMDFPSYSPIFTADHKVQEVINPDRAKKRYFTEALYIGIGIVFNLIGLILIAVFFFILKYNIIGYIFMGLAAFVLLAGGYNRIDNAFDIILINGRKIPNRKTPEETILTFFNSMSDKQQLWKRSFNCLTDTSQNQGIVKLPKDDYLQKLMPDVKINSLDSFKSFWKYIKFSRTPNYGSIITKTVDAQSVKLYIEIEARWREEDKNDPQQKEETIPCIFVLVKRGDYWFMADGFFWPKGQKYL